MKRLLVKLAKRLPGIRDLVAERDALRGLLAEEQEQRRKFEEAIEIERHRAAAEQRRTESHAATAQRLQDEVTRLTAELETAGARIERLEKRSDVERRAKLKGERDELRARYGAVRGQAAQARQRVRDLKERLRSERARVTDLKARLAGAHARLADLKGRSGEDRFRIESLKARASREKARADEAQATVDGVRADLARERSAKQKLRQQIIGRSWRPGYASRPDYVASRARFLEHCIELGKLQPDGRVLDVGCGIGGVAEQLATYLGDNGSYEGFDIMSEAIEVAKGSLGRAYPNFRFELADVYNSKYNPEGTHKPEDYRFPFDDDTFDLIVLRSVFTHMLPPEIENYLSEIGRTLKPGGRCLITYFLLNDRQEPELQDWIDEYFAFDRGLYRLNNEDLVEAAVALDESWVLAAYPKAGLNVAEPILYGSWRTPDKETLDGQDLITAEKPA